MAAACSCESCWERPAGGLEGFEGGQTASLNALKTDASGVCESCRGKSCGGGFGGFESGQTAGLNALKNRCLQRVAARVAVEACGRVGRV